MKVESTDRVVVRPHVHCRSFEGEMVVLDLEGGDYFALNEVGTAMWEALASGQCPAEIASALAPRYSVGEDTVVTDCIALIEELLRSGLVDLRRP
jgi:hypothetical protein